MKPRILHLLRHLRQALRTQTAYYAPGAYQEIIFSYSQKHYHPFQSIAAEYAFMSAGVIARHIYQALSTLGPVYYADEPALKRAKLFVTQNNWSTGMQVKARHTVLFLPTSHLEQRRERYIRHAALYGISPEQIVGCPSLQELECYRRGLQRADRIIILGNDTVKQTFLTRDIPATKLVMLNSGVDFQHFLPQPRDHEAIRIVFPATYPTIGKGFPFLMEAWQRIQAEMPHRKSILDVLGDRGRRDIRIEQYAHVPNVRWNGKYIGGSQDHIDKLASAHYVVFPSLSEGQAGTLLEAMSCGCVPIATRESGIDADQYGGWVVEGGNTESLHHVLNTILVNYREDDWQNRSAIARQKIMTHHDWNAFDQSIKHICATYVT